MHKSTKLQVASYGVPLLFGAMAASVLLWVAGYIPMSYGVGGAVVALAGAAVFYHWHSRATIDEALDEFRERGFECWHRISRRVPAYVRSAGSLVERSQGFRGPRLLVEWVVRRAGEAEGAIVGYLTAHGRHHRPRRYFVLAASCAMAKNSSLSFIPKKEDELTCPHFLYQVL
jgi:hypothetical protein